MKSALAVARKKKDPVPAPGQADEITTIKCYKQLAKTLNKLGALLDLSQPEVLLLFRREFENRLLTETEKELRGLTQRRQDEE